MRALAKQCTCEPRDWKADYWKHQPCAACEAWSEEHSKLIHALGLKPWQDVTDPDAANPYPAGSAAADWFEKNRNPEAEALWRALDQAANGELNAKCRS